MVAQITFVILNAPRAVSYIPGGITTYQVQATVGNDGPTYAPSTRFTVTPPANTTVTAMTAGAGSCDAGAGTCDLGDLAISAAVPVTVTLSVGPGAAEDDMLTTEANVAIRKQ